MKSLFSFLTMAGFAFHLHAQVTLSANDMPQPGDILHYAEDSTVADLNIGVPGGAQSWDFSSLSADLEQVISVIPVEQSPLAAEFPDANICLQTDEYYQYGQLSAEHFNALGIALYLFDTENLTALRFSPPQSIIEFPTTWNSSYSSTYGIDLKIDGADLGVDSIRIRQVATKEVIFDSYGDLILPSGTFEAIRAREYTTSHDSLFVQLFGFWQLVDASVIVDSVYQWYGPAGKGVLATINLDPLTGTPAYASYFSSIETQVQAPVAQFTYQLTGGIASFADESTNQPTEWLWDFGDNTTSTDQNPTHEYSVSGTYEVCLTATNEGGSSTICQSVVVIVTGTDETGNVSGIIVFPNPMSDRFHIQIDNQTLLPGCTLHIFDATGRLLEQHKVSDSNWSMPVHNFVAGTYFYQLQNAKGEVIHRGKLLKNE